MTTYHNQPGGRARQMFWSALLALFLGVVAWIGVEYWLSGSAAPGEPANQAGVSGAGTLPVPRQVPNLARNEPGAESARPQPPAVRLPVDWATRPREFPPQGIAATATRHTDSESETQSVFFTFHETHIEAAPGLADGQYFWKSDGPLWFPITHSTFVEVSSGKVSLRETASRQPAACVVVFYRVAVRIRTNTNQREAVRVSLTCPSQSDASAEAAEATYAEEFPTLDGQIVHMLVPRGPLRFALPQPNVNLPSDFDVGMKCSLGDRAPEEDELIELTFDVWKELTIRLIEPSPGALWSHVERLGSRGDVAVGVALENWGGNRHGLRLAGKWRVAPGVHNPQAVVVVTVPPLARDCTASATLSIGASSTMAAAGAAPVARGKADFVTGAHSYVLDATVFSTDWTVLVRVKDTEGKPVADYTVAVRLVNLSEAEPVWFGAESRQRTDELGTALFAGLRSGPDLFARVSFETRPPRDLNPDLKTDYAYDTANPITDIEVVLPATIGRPLVVEFDTTNLEQSWTPQQQASGAVRATAVPYLVIPRSVNRKLDCDASASVRIDERSRLVTNVRSPGEYDILTMTRAGEVWVVGHRHAADARVAGVKVQPGVQARVSLVDGQGQPLSGAIICTAAPSPEIVWALAQAHRKDYIRFFSRQTTSAAGTCAFACQPSSADPSQWLAYHESIGVFRLVSISGTLREGFQLSTGTRVASGSVTVKADMRDLAGKKLLLCVSPVFIENSGTLTELFAFLGATIEVVDGEARLGKLPVGRYAISVLELADNEYRPLGDQWSRLIEVRDGQPSEIRLPAK